MTKYLKLEVNVAQVTEVELDEDKTVDAILAALLAQYGEGNVQINISTSGVQTEENFLSEISLEVSCGS
jgi:hypothetical protein